jgi:tetratricopeptide (TPR) repeat protein
MIRALSSSGPAIRLSQLLKTLNNCNNKTSCVFLYLASGVYTGLKKQVAGLNQKTMDTVKQLIAKAEQLNAENNSSAIVTLLSDTVLHEHKDSTLYNWRAWAHLSLVEQEKAILYAADAIKIADEKIATNSANDNVYFERGYARSIKNEYDKAVEDYTKAIELKSDENKYYTNRAFAWSSFNEYDKAIADYDKAIELNPNLSQTFADRGITWNLKGEYDKAIDDFKIAIDLSPKSNYYNWRAIAWYNKAKYDDAIGDYNEAIQLDGNNSIAYNNRGLVWLLKKDESKAVADFIKAIELDAKNADAYRNRGSVFYDTGEFEKAIADFVKAREIEPVTFSYLEANIKQATEKIEERNKMVISKAAEVHKTERMDLEQQISNTINAIRAAAKSEVKTVVHYTKLFVADIYVKGSPKDKKTAKMQYSNAIYMNDPMEGKVFFDYLNEPGIEKAYYNGEKRTETSVYLGSFLPVSDKIGETSHEDELVMWRTYGKDENDKEAAGCSVVLSSDFFRISTEKKERAAASDTTSELLNVVYVKQKERLINDAGGKMEDAINELKKQLEKLIKVRNKYPETDDFYKDIENGIFRELSKISFLFKTADYQFENEVRVITYMPRDSDLVKFREVNEVKKPSKRFFIESHNDILPFIKKIYLGPKVEHYQQWSLYFDYEIRQRAKELNEMSPPPYKIKPAEIEIRKSENKFQ